jgi:phage/plasmid-like protein (TIGR03299 family)
MTFVNSDTRVDSAFAANNRGPAVYGNYRSHGYAVNTLPATLGAAFVPANATPSEAFRVAGLDWTADKQPAYYHGTDGPTPSAEHCSIVRSDTGTLLGIHGSGYTPLQNHSLIDVLDQLGPSVSLESVLSLRGGRRIYATASIDTEDDVLPGDRIRRQLHLFNSHDGSTSFGAFFTDVRLWCANQLNYLTGKEFSNAESKGNGMRRKHTSRIDEFVQALPSLIDAERQTFHKTIDEFRSMTTVKLTPELATRILMETFSDKLSRPISVERGSKEKRQRMLSDLTEVPVIRDHYTGVTGFGTTEPEAGAGTAYALFNSITQFCTHDGSSRLKSDTERARIRLEALWGGESAQRIERTRTAILALV